MPSGISAAGAAAAYAAQTDVSAKSDSASGFGAALEHAVESAIDVGHQADAASTQALTGQGSVTDVVVAVSRAELTLQTAVAVRDRVVSAYQEVMRMPI